MGKFSSKSGVKTLILSAISLGGGGGYLSLLLASKNHSSNNEKLGGFASIYNTT